MVNTSLRSKVLIPVTLVIVITAVMTTSFFAVAFIRSEEEGCLNAAPH